MSLMLSPFKFNNSIDSLESANPNATNQIGTQITAGFPSTMGTIVKIFDALPFDVHHVVISAAGFNASGVDSNATLTVFTDPTGGTTWTEFIPYLQVGYTPTLDYFTNFCSQYAFPLFIKAGTSVGIGAVKRGATTLGTTPRVVMWLYGDPNRPDMWWCGQKVERVNSASIDAGASFTPGNTNTWGAWADVGTSTQRYGAIQFGVNGPITTPTAATAIGYFVQVGVNGNKFPGSHTLHRTLTTAETGSVTTPATPIFCDTPAGTTFQMRGMASGTNQVLNGNVYGVY